MSDFSTLNAAVADLRNLLSSCVGSEALSDISVRLPSGKNDEASFLRLINWSYVLIFEAGRVAIPYLLEFRKRDCDSPYDPQVACERVRSLRTWISHNMFLENDRDLKLSRNVHRWFHNTCGVSPPQTACQWENCCHTLCAEVIKVIECCQVATNHILSLDDDGQETIADLRRRIQKVWPAYEFDKLVNDAAIRIGLKINVKTFRERRLNKWREFVEYIPESDNPEGQVIRMIERDLLNYSANILPISGQNIMEILNLDPGPQVGIVLLRVRDIVQGGVSDPDEIKKIIISEYK